MWGVLFALIKQMGIRNSIRCAAPKRALIHHWRALGPKIGFGWQGSKHAWWCSIHMVTGIGQVRDPAESLNLALHIWPPLYNRYALSDVDILTGVEVLLYGRALPYLNPQFMLRI